MINKQDILLIKEAAADGTLDAFLDEQLKIAEQHICSIDWVTDDIKELRNYSPERLSEAVNYVRKGLQDRSTEEGWEILEDLLWMFDWNNSGL